MSNAETWIKYKDLHLEFSNRGNCRNIKTKILLKPSIRKKYLSITTKKLGRKTINICIHRAVAELFVETSNEKADQVNHIDGNKNNNTSENLEWVTLQQNITHACVNNLRSYHSGEVASWSRVDDLSSLAIRTFSIHPQRYFILKDYGRSPTMIFNHMHNKVFKHLPIITLNELNHARNS